MLTAFGSAAVGFMLITYWLEERSIWFVALFSLSSAAASAYGFLIGSYPFGAIEALWAVVAAQRFLRRRAVAHRGGEA